MQLKRRGPWYLMLPAGTALLLVPALINGLPFVYSDTGAYLGSAVQGTVPFDRPYWYGAFMGLITQHGRSLWPVAIAQAFLSAYAVNRIAGLLLPNGVRAAEGLVLFGGLTALTSLPWYSGLLIPDIFTALGLLAVFGLMHPRATLPARAMDALMIAASIWFHFSNVVILPLAGLALLGLQRKVEGRSLLMPAAALLATLVLAMGGLALAHRVLTGQAFLTRGGHVFMMGRMVDTGMLKPYLDEHCPGLGICAYADSLPPHSQAFLWWGSSPLAKQGGWEATEGEYSAIVRGSLTEPRYLLWHVRGSIASTARQLMEWRICGGMESQWYRQPDSAPRGSIAANAPHLDAAFMSALQNGGRGELRMRLPDRIYQLALGISLLIAAAVLIRDRAPERADARRFLTFTLAAVLIGAWVCCSISVVDTRYLGRDSWLIPLAVMLWGLLRWQQRRDGASAAPPAR